jgi:hypothetical protein
LTPAEAEGVDDEDAAPAFCAWAPDASSSAAAQAAM